MHKPTDAAEQPLFLVLAGSGGNTHSECSGALDGKTRQAPAVVDATGQLVDIVGRTEMMMRALLAENEAEESS
jgi:hypothetical protein